ncbi:sensor histidine kinase [Nonomuraea longispora]|uniref:histidine kinase n=1 Tax=Nonomuraea longispora TaxID=1848320 RepID=A0A4R4N951_9ACTN|nr:sensor histidine kinase [Nonomuraea longispora]TDC03853.1 sensor histidine kinase [Nonomuraea longispora]
MSGVETGATEKTPLLSWTVDAAVVAVLIAIFWAQPLLTTASGASMIVGVTLAAAVAAAVLLRWKFPTIAPTVALVATGVGSMLQVSTDPMLAVAWCLYPLALRRGVQTRIIGSAAILVMMLVLWTYGAAGSSAVEERVIYAGIAIGASWLLGRAEARRLEATRHAVRQHAEAEQARQQTAMAREVHDVVGHALSVIRAEADVSRNLPGLGESELRESLAGIEHRARGALEEVQALVRALRLGQTDSGRATPLPQLVAAAQVSGIDVTTRIDLPDTMDDVSLVVSRVVQEALSNVVRHANANRCEVAVWQEDQAVSVRIDDDGTGLSAGHTPGTGLTGMRERVEGIGGSLTVTNRLEGGTRVLAKIPAEVAS